MSSLCRLTYFEGVLCTLPHLSLIMDAIRFWLVNLFKCSYNAEMEDPEPHDSK